MKMVGCLGYYRSSDFVHVDVGVSAIGSFCLTLRDSDSSAAELVHEPDTMAYSGPMTTSPGRRTLFNAIDPSPFRDKDLDPKAEEFIVGWAKELPRPCQFGRVPFPDRLALCARTQSRLCHYLEKDLRDSELRDAALRLHRGGVGYYHRTSCTSTSGVSAIG